MEELILGELTERKIGYGIIQPGESTIGGVPVIKVNNIISGLKSIQDLDTTHPENDQKYRKTRLNGGEIIISVVGTIGKTAIVPMDFKGCNLVRATALIDIKDPILSRWVKYYIDSPKGQSYINGNLNTTVQPTLNIKSLVEMPIPFYGREYAEKVVAILSKIDDKIENNRKINDNLEQQAQAAFNNIIAHYSESETINLSEIAVLNPKRTIAKGTLARSIEMAQLPTSGSFPAGWDMKEYNGGMKFQNGDTLMARITPCLENGKVAYINFLEENEVAFGSTEYIVIASKGAIAPEVFYFLTRHNDFVDFAVKNMNGSSGRQRVSAETIGTYKLPIISPEDMVILETIAKEALNKIKYNSLENIRLSEIRDTLLPKLMSGQLKINEIDC